MIFRTSDIGIKSAVEVLRRLSCHGGFKLAIAFCSLAGHSRIHGLRLVGNISTGIVHDIFRIVCDGAVFRGIGDIRRGHFRLRFLTVLTNHRFCDTIPFLLGIALVTVFVLRVTINAFAILASRRGIPLFISQCILRIRRGLGKGIVIALGVLCNIFHSISSDIGSGFFPVSIIAFFCIGSRTFFIMSEFAFCFDTIPIGYFSIIRNTIRRNGSSTVMLVPITIQFVILHGNLAYIELASDRQVFIYGDIFLKFCFAFHGQFVTERGLASDTERAADRGILEVGFASHIERTIHIRLFERGITCDTELLIHGHVALEVRSIFHDQRVCLQSAADGCGTCSIQRSNTRQAFVIGIHFCVLEVNAIYGSAFG